MVGPELEEFLMTQRTCRIGTARRGRGPHVTPMWFLWHDGAVWLNSLVSSRRWADLQADPRVAVLVDAGEQYTELRGVEMTGHVEPVGECPRTGLPLRALMQPEALFAQKYRGTSDLQYDGRHAWLRLLPDRLVSWDFRKINQR